MLDVNVLPTPPLFLTNVINTSSFTTRFARRSNATHWSGFAEHGAIKIAFFFGYPKKWTDHDVMNPHFPVFWNRVRAREEPSDKLRSCAYGISRPNADTSVRDVAAVDSSAVSNVAKVGNELIATTPGGSKVSESRESSQEFESKKRVKDFSSGDGLVEAKPSKKGRR